MLTVSAELVAGSDRNFYEKWKIPDRNITCLDACKGVSTYVINKSLNIIYTTLFKTSLYNAEKFKACEKILTVTIKL